MTIGTSITIEDLEIYVPSDEKDGARINHSKSYKRGSKIAHHNKKSRTYKFYLANDTTLSQLEEMTRNPYFASVPIYNMSKRINTGFIERYSRKGQYGVSDISMTMAHGYGKFLYIWDEIERPLHDRWRILISEDFSTDLGAYPQPWQANADVFGGNPSANSLGDSDQIQDIPWEEIQGDWETDTDLGDHLSGTQCILYTSNATVGNLVGGWNWWENYVVESWVRIEDATGDNVGISFRYVDANNHYLFYTGDATEIILAKRVGGALTRIIGNSTFNIIIGTWYHYKVEVQGHRIKCYVNGELLIDKIDDEFSSGRAGMYAYNNNTYFDNFRVTLLPTVNFNLPASVDWHNQYSHADIVTAYGTQQKLIAPNNNVQFKQSKAGTDCALYLPMNEGQGDICYDHSMNKNHAIFYGDPTWVDDEEKGWCLEFDGDDDYINSSVDGLFDSSDYLTVDFEIKFPDTSATQTSVYLMRDSWDNFRWEYINGTGIRFFDDIDNIGVTVYQDTSYVENTWVRISTIFNNTHFLCFIDGELVYIYENSAGDSIEDMDADDFRIGRQVDYSSYGYCRVKNVRIFDAVRWDVATGHDSTPATVFIWDDNRFNSDYDYPIDDCLMGGWHFDEGSGTTTYDFSGRGHDATLTTAPNWYDTSFRGEAGTCLDFELSSTEFLTVSDHDDFSFGDGSTDVPFSIELWVKFESSTASQVLISKDNPGTAREWALMFNAATPDAFRIYCLDDSLGGYIGATGSTSPSDDTWYYVVCTYDGSGAWGGFQLYVNGIAETMTNSSSGSYTAMENLALDVLIGKAGNGSPFDGLIDEVRIHRRELSANEIAARYRSEPYLHDWHQMTRVYDISKNLNGLPVISNGLIMLSFPDYDVYERRVNNVLAPTVYAWYENSWHIIGTFDFVIQSNGSAEEMIYDSAHSEWEIEELTDQYCKMRIRYYQVSGTGHPEGGCYDFKLIIRNGYPGVLFETDSSDWLQEDRMGIIFRDQTVYGYGIKNKFWYAPEDNLYDAEVLAANQSRTSAQVDDNWYIVFGSSDYSDAPSKNVIVGGFNDCELDDLGSNIFWYIPIDATLNVWRDIYNKGAKYGGIFFVPYDVDDLFQEADSDYADITTDGENDQSVLAGYTGDGYIRLYVFVGSEYAQWQVDSVTNLPKGTYMAVARVASSDADAGDRDGIMNVDNDNDHDGDLATKTFQVTAQNTWEYQFLIFYTDGTNDVYISVESAGANDEIFVDYFLCIPLANAINYPSDLAHYAFNENSLIRGLKK